LTPSEVCSFFRRMLQVKRSHTRLEMPLRDPLWHEFLRVSPRRYAGWIHGCSIGFNGLALDCDGTVYPCRRLPIPLGNIRTESLSDIWRHSPILQQLRGRDSLKGRCRTCNRRWLCGGCRAMAYALTGDYLEEDPQCIQQCSTIARSLARTRSLWPRSP
jgi:radical SAM protein with 4Fe4S-binding SPASM domain